MILALAWRNLWKNSRRTLLTLCAIAFACGVMMFFMALQDKSYETGISATTGLYHGHLQIQAPGYLEKPQIRKVIRAPEQVSEILRTIPNVAAASPRTFSFALASTGSRSYGVQVMGVDPDTEPTVSTIAASVRQGRALSVSDTTSSLIGIGLAKNLKVGVGDEITLLGQGYDGSLASTVIKVEGIFETGSSELDRNLLQMPINEMKSVFYLEELVHTYALKVSDFDLLSATKFEIKSALASRDIGSLAVVSWEDLLPGLKESIELDMSAGWLFFGALVVIVTFSVLNTFLMTVLERTKEFGVVLALGMPDYNLVWLVICEGLLLGLLGVLCGIVLGSGVISYFGYFGFSIPGTEEIRKTWNLPGTIYPALTFRTIYAGPLLLVICTTIASVYPAIKTRYIEIANAIRVAR